MDYIYAKFHQILTNLLVDAYYGALHASLQDWVLTPLVLVLGIEINRWFKIGSSKVSITVILPTRVKYLRFHNLNNDLIFCILSV